MPELVRTKLINRHYNNSLINYFDIKKTREPIAQKYQSPTVKANIESYVKRYNIYLASESVKHKPYGDLQFFSVPTY